MEYGICSMISLNLPITPTLKLSLSKELSSQMHEFEDIPVGFKVAGAENSRPKTKRPRASVTSRMLPRIKFGSKFSKSESRADSASKERAKSQRAKLTKSPLVKQTAGVYTGSRERNKKEEKWGETLLIGMIGGMKRQGK
ncbi:hypothetical protein K0M31_010340 [Melipona bicolor]|uniref:Uncharacterized protein n=1 Tax=Melipona bicolor TaxID=60889 RepID=A0AA40FLS8_9HYME|nr:hypothetical protein K0M31_010340 [Melipona bicolor]